MNVKRTIFMILCTGFLYCGAIFAMLTKEEIAKYEKALGKEIVEAYLKKSLEELDVAASKFVPLIRDQLKRKMTYELISKLREKGGAKKAAIDFAPMLEEVIEDIQKLNNKLVDMKKKMTK